MPRRKRKKRRRGLSGADPSDDVSAPSPPSHLLGRLSQPRMTPATHSPESLQVLPWTEVMAGAGAPDTALCCVGSRQGQKRSISCYQLVHAQRDDEVEFEELGHLSKCDFCRVGVFDGKLIVSLSRDKHCYVSLHDVLNEHYAGHSCSPETLVAPQDPVIEALCPLEVLSETTRAGHIRGGSVTNVSACRLLCGNYSRKLDIVHAQTFKVVHSISTVQVVSMRHFPRVSSDNFYIGRGGTSDLGAVCLNVEKGKETMTFYGTNTNLTYGLDVDVGRSLLYSGDCNGVVAAWDYRTGKNTSKWSGSSVKRIVVDEPRNIVIVCQSGGIIHTIDVRKAGPPLGPALSTPRKGIVDVFPQPTPMGETTPTTTYVAVYSSGSVCRFDPVREPGKEQLRTKFGAGSYTPKPEYWGGSCSSARFVCRGDFEGPDEAVVPMREFIEFVCDEDGICSAVRDAVFCRVGIGAVAGEKTLVFRSMLV